MRDPDHRWVLKVRTNVHKHVSGLTDSTWYYVKNLWRGALTAAGASEAYEYTTLAAASRAKRKLKRLGLEAKIFRRAR